VRVVAGDKDGGRVLVADVDGEGLAALAVEHDHAHHPLHAREQVALAALVVVQAADHAAPREGEVRLLHRLREARLAHQLHEPAPVVFVAAQWDQLDAVDHSLLAPLART
jgi:hypothetical protein